MLRTNSKKYLQNVQSFILDSVSGLDYNVKTDTPSEKMAFLWDCFNKEYNYQNNVLRYPNIKTRFANWLSGLPSVIDLPFTNYEILETSKKLLETDNLTAIQEDKILANYYNFMSYHVLKLISTH